MALAVAALAAVAGVPAAVGFAQADRALENLPSQAATAVEGELKKRFSTDADVVFVVAIGDNGELQPAPLPGVTARTVPAGYRPPEEAITKEMTIRIVEYEKNSHCYVYYHSGTQVEYCPRH